MNLLKMFFVLVIISVVLFLISRYLAPGSYPYAEEYEFNVPEDSLILVIKQVKEENPDINFSNSNAFQTGKTIFPKDERNNWWYSIYFYYKDKNQIIHTWTRPLSKRKTTFAFVAINDGLEMGNWREVNRSFWWWKNAPEIEEFQHRILQKINNKIFIK